MTFAAPDNRRPPWPRPRLYFGHPINTYGTPLETRLLAVLAEAFPHHEIVNPSGPEHQAGYAEYEKTRRDEDGKPTGMGYFFEVVLPTCHAGAHLAFRDGMFGKGVFGEATWQCERGLPVWEITPQEIIFRHHAPFDPKRCLSREGTWARLTDQKQEGLSTEPIVFKPY